MNRCLKDKLYPVIALAAVAFSATASGLGVDAQDMNSLSFVVNAGVNAGDALSATCKVAVIIQHADVNTDASFANCADDDMFEAEDGANGVAKYLDATGDASAVHFVHYRGNKRYVRLRFVETGTVSMPLAAVAIGGHLEAQPAL